MHRKILIIGGNGQDGFLLRQILSTTADDIFHTSRKKKFTALKNEHEIIQKFTEQNLVTLIEQIKPDLVFYCAAVHGSSEERVSWESAQQVNFIIPKRICEKFRTYSMRFVYFNSIKSLKINEDSLITPECTFSTETPYSQSKSKFSKWLLKQESFEKLSFSNLYFSNHESKYRGRQFLSSRVCHDIKRRLGIYKKIPKLNLHSLDFWCDWGSAYEYMSIIANQKFLKKCENKHLTFATGSTVYGLDLLTKLYANYGLNFNDCVTCQDKKQARPFNVETKFLENVNFRPKIKSFQVFNEIINQI